MKPLNSTCCIRRGLLRFIDRARRVRDQQALFLAYGQFSAGQGSSGRAVRIQDVHYPEYGVFRQVRNMLPAQVIMHGALSQLRRKQVDFRQEQAPLGICQVHGVQRLGKRRADLIFQAAGT